MTSHVRREKQYENRIAYFPLRLPWNTWQRTRRKEQFRRRRRCAETVREREKTFQCPCPWSDHLKMIKQPITFITWRNDNFLQHIDCRRENDRFQVFASCVTISNPGWLSSSETRINLGIRSWKKHLSEWARCQKAIGGIYFTKKWRTETLQPGLEFATFKPRLKRGIFKCVSCLNGSFFWGWWSVFSERGSQDLSNDTTFTS